MKLLNLEDVFLLVLDVLRKVLEELCLVLLGLLDEDFEIAAEGFGEGLPESLRAKLPFVYLVVVYLIIK